MNETFKKIKNKFLIAAIIISVSAGAFAGLAAAGAVLLALKLNAVDINAGFYVLIAFGTAALCGVPLFFALRPTDKKVAIKLDKDYSLNEKVQTMVEFSESLDGMAVLQRKDASEKLNSVPRKKSAPLKVLSCLLVPLVACGIFVSGVAMPARAKNSGGNGTPDDFVITNWQITALKSVIEEVNSSSLENGLKTSFAGTLGDLLNILEETDTGTEMTAQVKSAAKKIDGFVAEANSYKEITDALEKNAEYESYATKVTGAVVLYKADGSRITTFDRVAQKETELESSISAHLEGSFSEVEEELSALNAFSAFTARVKAFISDFNAVYNEIDERQGDALYTALTEYKIALDGVASNAAAGSGYGVQALKALVLEADTALISSSTAALCVQSYNFIMDDYVKARLSDIFSVSLGSASDGSGGPGDEQGTEPPPEETGPGGYGSGDTLYGSNDLIYYPDENKQVEYGNVLNDYYAKAEELMRSLPDDLKGYLGEYFDILFSGFKDKN